MNRSSTNQKGFTLIEAIVSTTVFAFLVSSVLGVYIATTRLDARTRAQRAVTQNARYILEYMAKEVRNGTISYTSYPSNTTVGRTDLYVTNQEGFLERIYYDGTQNIVLDKSGVGTTNLNSTGVRVTRAEFLVSPTVDPLTPAKLSNLQPTVTVILNISANYGGRPEDIVNLPLQTTFTARNYPSRE